MKKILGVFLGSLLLVNSVSADVTQSGKITELWVNDASHDNVAFISVGQSYATSCYSAPVRYFIIDLSQPGMQEAYAMALAAYMADHTITMGSGGVCHDTVEKLKYISLQRSDP